MPKTGRVLSAAGLSVHRIRFSLITCEADAHAIQERVSALFHCRLRLDFFETGEAFSFDAGEVVHIDRMVLDLGDVPLHALEVELRKRLLQALANKLLQIGDGRAISGESAGGLDDEMRLSLADTSDSSIAATPHQRGRQKSHVAKPGTSDSTGLDAEEQDYIAPIQLKTYLQSGHLGPALAEALEKHGFSAWLQHQLVSLPPHRRDMRDAWHRSLLHACLESSSLQRLLLASQPALLERIANFWLGDTVVPYVAATRPDWRRLLPLCALIGAGRDDGDFFRSDTQIWQPWLTAEPWSPLEVELLEVAKKMELLPADFPSSVSERMPVQHQERRETKRSHPAATAVQAAGEILHVTGAGLSLLWPLLPNFMARLGLVKDGAFIDEHAVSTAVCRLDSLVWSAGADNVPVETADGIALSMEWRAGFAKFLCGLPQDALIAPWSLPVADEAQAMREWLAWAQRQLPGLHRCSEDDLRSLFLQRPGTLLSVDGRWKLQVQREPVDALLVDLPWPMSYLSLPWLASPLEVEWC